MKLPCSFLVNPLPYAADSALLIRGAWLEGGLEDAGLVLGRQETSNFSHRHYSVDFRLPCIFRC